MSRHHVIISGTGRAGTTFLVQLLTELKLDTGFSDPFAQVSENCNAGMEKDIRTPDAPYIVKSPWMCDYLDSFLEQEDVIIDYAIIPVRDLFSAAESRRVVAAQSPRGGKPNTVPGGLWDANIPEDQENILSKKLYSLIFTLVKYDIAHTFLIFPKFASDPVYLFSKLWFLLKGRRYETFQTAFNKVRKPGIIHSFTSAPEQPHQISDG